MAYKVESRTRLVAGKVAADSPAEAGAIFHQKVFSSRAPKLRTEPIPDGPQRLTCEKHNTPYLFVTAPCGSRFALYPA